MLQMGSVNDLANVRNLLYEICFMLFRIIITKKNNNNMQVMKRHPPS